MNEKKFCVYKHTSPDGKVYIGITCREPQKRWRNGKGYAIGTYFRNAIDKYGWDNFEHEILASGLTEDEASLAEDFYINLFNATDRECGYNLKSGGFVGGRYTVTVKAKISKSNREFWDIHPEMRKEFSERMVGKKKSIEARQKMSVSKTGKHPYRSEEHNQKIAEGIRSYYATHQEDAVKQGNRIAQYSLDKRKAIVQLRQDGSLVSTYESARAAERATGIDNRNINSCCRGFKKSVGGYKWQFAIDYNSGREIAL